MKEYIIEDINYEDDPDSLAFLTGESVAEARLRCGDEVVYVSLATPGLYCGYLTDRSTIVEQRNYDESIVDYLNDHDLGELDEDMMPDSDEYKWLTPVFEMLRDVIDGYNPKDYVGTIIRK